MAKQKVFKKNKNDVQKIIEWLTDCELIEMSDYSDGFFIDSDGVTKPYYYLRIDEKGIYISKKLRDFLIEKKIFERI